MDKKIIEYFYDNSIRAEKIIHLGIQCIDELSPDVKEEFKYDYNEISSALGLESPDLLDGDDEDISSLFIESGKLGFLIKFATPVPKFYSDNSDSYSFSWSFCRMEWIYGETLEEACKKAIEWKEVYINSEKQERNK